MYHRGFQIIPTHYGDMSLPINERCKDLHARAFRLASRVAEQTADAMATNITQRETLGPRQMMAWDMIAESYAWNATEDSDPADVARWISDADYETDAADDDAPVALRITYRSHATKYVDAPSRVYRFDNRAKADEFLAAYADDIESATPHTDDDGGCTFDGAPLNENGTCPFGHTRDEQDAYDQFLADDAARHERECGAQFTTGGADPYGTHCDRDKNHRGEPHEGDDPFGNGGRVRWNGGGSCAGDPVPVRDVEYVPASDVVAVIAPPSAGGWSGVTVPAVARNRVSAETFDGYVSAIMDRIHEDMEDAFPWDKWIPRNVGSFDAIHRYCDANGYVSDHVPCDDPECTCPANRSLQTAGHTDRCAVTAARERHTDLANAIVSEVHRRLALEAIAIERDGYKSDIPWIFRTPDGVHHLQIPDAPCATCGRRHDLGNPVRRDLAETLRGVDVATIVGVLADLGITDEIRDAL